MASYACKQASLVVVVGMLPPLPPLLLLLLLLIRLHSVAAICADSCAGTFKLAEKARLQLPQPAR